MANNWQFIDGTTDELLTSKKVQTVEEKKTFKKTIEYDTDKTLTLDTELAHKKYVDDQILANAGGLLISGMDITMPPAQFVTVGTLTAGTLKVGGFYELYIAISHPSMDSIQHGLALKDATTGTRYSFATFASTGDGSSFIESFMRTTLYIESDTKLRGGSVGIPAGKSTVIEYVEHTKVAGELIANDCVFEVANTSIDTRTLKFAYIKKL